MTSVIENGNLRSMKTAKIGKPENESEDWRPSSASGQLTSGGRRKPAEEMTTKRRNHLKPGEKAAWQRLLSLTAPVKANGSQLAARKYVAATQKSLSNTSAVGGGSAIAKKPKLTSLAWHGGGVKASSPGLAKHLLISVREMAIRNSDSEEKWAMT